MSSFIDPEIVQNLQEKLSFFIGQLPSPIKERVDDFILSTSGKMLRPSLIALVTKILVQDEEEHIVKKSMDQAYESAIAVELLHNMTLIHDDLIDGAPLRRGKPSYHIQHGDERALHDGDILHAYGLKILTHIPSLQLFLRVSYDVGVGNSAELEDRLLNNYDFDLEHVIDIMRKKTAVVFAGCVQLGFYAAEKGVLFSKELEEAIINGGIAFQIQDDYLDFMGDVEKFGKIHLWDVQESKRNLFLYFALKKENADKIKKIYDKPVGKKTEEDIDFILKVFKKCAPQVKEQRDTYLLKTTSVLEKLQEETEDGNMIDLIDFLVMLNEYLAHRDI